MAELAAVLQTGGRPDVSDDIVVILDSLPLHPVALLGAAGGAAPGPPRPADGVDGPVGVRHQVAGDGQVGPEGVGQETVVLALAVGDLPVAEGVAVGLSVTPG